MSGFRWSHFEARRSTPAVLVAGTILLVAGVGTWVGETSVTRHDALTIDAPVHAAPSPVGESVAATSPSSSDAAAGEAAAIAPDSPTAPAEHVELVSDEPPVVRLAQTAGDPLPLPIRWGTSGSSIPGRCTQFEPILAELAPPSGWSVERMSRFGWRETKCCPQVFVVDPQKDAPPISYWRTTRGGDRFDDACNFTHIAEGNHRSDAGLLQINGINYDPARCANTCLSVWLDTPVTVATLGDPWLNVRAAARLCEFWVNAGSSCYRPWS